MYKTRGKTVITQQETLFKHARCYEELVCWYNLSSTNLSILPPFSKEEIHLTCSRFSTHRRCKTERKRAHTKQGRLINFAHTKNVSKVKTILGLSCIRVWFLKKMAMSAFCLGPALRVRSLWNEHYFIIKSICSDIYCIFNENSEMYPPPASPCLQQLIQNFSDLQQKWLSAVLAVKLMLLNH